MPRFPSDAHALARRLGVLAITFAGCTTDGAPWTPPPANPILPPAFTFGPPNDFLVVSIQGSPLTGPHPGNTLEGIEQASLDGIRFVEVDLVRTSDFGIVSGHEDAIPGCGSASAMTLEEVQTCVLSGGRHVATLDDLLAFDFEGIFLDLKSTSSNDPVIVEDVLASVALSVADADRFETVIAMTYRLPPDAVATSRLAGLRLGYKGYPADVPASIEFAETALSNGAEMICVNDGVLSPEMVASFLDRGLWVLGWSLSPERVEHWRDLEAAGMGGLITADVRLVEEEVAGVSAP